MLSLVDQVVMKSDLKQGRSQFGTPGRAKSFLRRSQIFWTMSNTFKPCPTHFSKGGENFSREVLPPCAPPGYGPAWNT